MGTYTEFTEEEVQKFRMAQSIRPVWSYFVPIVSYKEAVRTPDGTATAERVGPEVDHEAREAHAKATWKDQIAKMIRVREARRESQGPGQRDWEIMSQMTQASQERNVPGKKGKIKRKPWPAKERMGTIKKVCPGEM